MTVGEIVGSGDCVETTKGVPGVRVAVGSIVATVVGLAGIVMTVAWGANVGSAASIAGSVVDVSSVVAGGSEFDSAAIGVNSDAIVPFVHAISPTARIAVSPKKKALIMFLDIVSCLI